MRVPRWVERVRAVLAEGAPENHETFAAFARAANFGFARATCVLLWSILAITSVAFAVVILRDVSPVVGGVLRSDSPQAQLVWRLALLPVPMLGFLYLQFVVRTPDRFHLYHAIALLDLSGLASGWGKSQFGPVVAPWEFALIQVPIASVFLLIPFRIRVLTNLSIAAATLLGVGLADPRYLVHQSTPYLAFFLVTQSIVAIAWGHLWHIVGSEYFRQARELQDLNRHLATEVAKRTRESMRNLLDLEVAEERVRNAIARDLHDEMGHLIVLQGFELERFREAHAEQPEVAAKAGEFLAGLRGIEASVRRTVRFLRDGDFRGKLLAEIIEERLQFAKLEESVHAEQVVEPDELQLAPSQSLVVGRVLQELLTNIRKHADATHVAVSALKEGDRVLLRVSDDGKGFDPKQKTGGFGLRGIRERAASIGATVTIESGVANGTEVTIDIPTGAR